VLEWGPLLLKAGVRYRKYHATRHTFPTWLLEDGADVRWVQEQMGHASIEQTVGTLALVLSIPISLLGAYGFSRWRTEEELGPKVRRECVSLIDTVLKENRPQTPTTSARNCFTVA
jgi:hypothetical protein